jgi:hypothetical protein
MFPVGFELTISADKQPQTHALDWGGTGTAIFSLRKQKNSLPYLKMSEAGLELGKVKSNARLHATYL